MDIFFLPSIKESDFVVIFGCGKYGKTIYNYLQKTGRSKNILCFADNRINHKKKYKNKKILCPDLAKKICKRSLWIISSPQNASEMYKQLCEMRIKESDIILPTEEEIRLMYKNIHKFWYEESKHFMYEYGYQINFYFMQKWLKSIFYGIYHDIFFQNKEILHGIKNQYKYNVSICAIFLNEAPYMKEWIEFHRMIGIEHFYLYNNMSTDGYKSVLEKYIDEGIVTLIDWDVPHGQISAYKDCVKRFLVESRWIGFIDLDEFVVPRENKIYDFLKRYNNRCGSVLIYWKTYGSSKRKKRDLDGLVIEDFKKCWPKLGDLGKCFYNTGYPMSTEDKNGKGFYHICWTKKRNKDIPPINVFGKFSLPGGLQRASKEPAAIQINHYLIKSYEEYLKKMAQPDATFENNSRTNITFSYFDRRATGTDNLIERYLPELKERLK